MQLRPGSANIPLNAFRVVPGLPRRPCVVVLGRSSERVVAGAQPDGTRLAVPPPFTPMAEVPILPQGAQDPVGARGGVPPRCPVVAVVVGLQRYNVPALREVALGPRVGHPLAPGPALLSFVFLASVLPWNRNRRTVTGVIVVSKVEAVQTLRCFPDLHPQSVSGSEVSWLKPVDRRIHQAVPLADPRAKLASQPHAPLFPPYTLQ